MESNMPNYPKQSTESRLASEKWLDRLSINGALAVMLDNQAEAVSALKAALPQIEKAIEAGDHSLSASDTGRLIYAGAGHLRVLRFRMAQNYYRPLTGLHEWPI